MKKQTPRLLFILLCIFSASIVHAQDSARAAAIGNKLKAKTYTIEVSSVSPMKGGTRQLTPGYSLQVTPGSIQCDLPYFGRVQGVNPGNTDGGIKFTSTKFDYDSEVKKNSLAEIKIKPKDIRTTTQLFLTVFDNGNCTIRVSSSDRDPISYSGLIK